MQSSLRCLLIGVVGLAMPAMAQTPDVEELRNQAQEAASSGRWTDAAAAFRKVVTAEPDDARAWHMLGYSLHMTNDLDHALEAHLKAASFEETAGLGTYNAACVYALKGDTDRAFEWLGKAIEAGFADANQLERDTDMDGLRDDPRFKEIVAKMKKVKAKPSAGPQVSTSSGDRKGFRLFFWQGNGSPGQIAIDFGQPPWREQYASAVESGKHKNHRWRLGQNFWTTMDSNVDMEIGGVHVPAGYYYLTLEQKDDGFTLALLDPAEVRKNKTDAFQAEQTSGGIEVPMTIENSDKTAEKLDIALKLKSGSKSEGALVIRFGPHRVTAPVVIKL